MKARTLIVLGLIAAFVWPAQGLARRPLHWLERSAWRLSFADTNRDGAAEVYAENLARRPMLPATDWGAVKELVAYCQDHKAGLLIKTDNGAWGYSFFGAGYGVSYQVNDAPPVSQTWAGANTVNTAVYPGDAIAFLANLPDEGSITFRVTDANGRDHDAVFRLRGVTQASGLIARACAKAL